MVDVGDVVRIMVFYHIRELEHTKKAAPATPRPIQSADAIILRSYTLI